MYGFCGNHEWGTHPEIIKAIVKRTQCKKYLELGIYDATTISEIAKIVDYAVGVDCLDLRKYYNFNFIQSSTDDFFKNNTETFDIIFIDADHTFDSVKKDFENALNILNKHGIIFLHDTDPMNIMLTQPGYCNNCYKIVKYIRENHKELDLINLPISEAGLTIVNRKDENRHLCY